MDAEYRVGDTDAGERLDAWLSRQLEEVSRSRIQQWIKDACVTVNGETVKPNVSLKPDDLITVRPPPVKEVTLTPEAIPLDILFEDSDVLVLNKPAGLVVHPAAGHDSGTLVNALLHHCNDLTGIGGELRPGIVHRLDKDTSGLMIVAKTEAAMAGLSHDFKERRVTKHYWALVRGVVQPESGRIETLIGRDPHHRKRMSARVERGRTARSQYETIESLGEATLLNVSIETGRTHQIRVHMAHLGHPILGDSEYGRARKLADGTEVPRQMLHARSLALQHPVTGADLEFSAPLPDDFREIIRLLRERKPPS